MTNIVLNDDAWQDVEEGTEALLDDWLVGAGDSVSQGQVIANVVLVKTTHEIEAPAGGTIQSIEIDEQDNFTRGAVLAIIG